ncbi:hypothetical protein WR25_07905 isoform C [Diploscapter pachys]|nr:hypothetical protein WR25_07905 isoform B [Diploscapter pachys]PAV88525.1 hypothetical protein WR25_07905 isoform C [Diploscapter pachys]
MKSSGIDAYRSQASFKVEDLRNTIFGEEYARYRKEALEVFLSDPLFLSGERQLSQAEGRERTHQRWKRLVEMDFFNHADLIKSDAIDDALNIWDFAVTPRELNHLRVFGGAIESSGTERHAELLRKTKNHEIVGAFCLTELSHGSNTSKIQTTATFDKGEFVFHTPNIGATKCWAGNLGFSATHAIVYAQLYVGGNCYGIHAFVLQIRIGIVLAGSRACLFAATVAIRYSVERKQFGPSDSEEIAVIEYPLQRHRLFPYLAAGVVLRVFQRIFSNHFSEYKRRIAVGEKSTDLVEFSREIHALSSCTKPVSTFIGMEALGEARRACGGHGFLRSSNLNSVYSNYDPSQTFEGENNLLMQQTSNIILAKVAGRNSETRNASPMNLFNFLAERPKRFEKYSSCIVHDVLSAYEYLIHYLIQVTIAERHKLKTEGKDPFTILNETQV